MACAACGCDSAQGAGAHAIAAALREDDLDAALSLGLLDATIACPRCSDGCRAMLEDARRDRLDALAARERFRARNARIERRQRERAERRKPATVPGAAGPASTLPPAAAAALARAKARAAGRRGP
jgi:hypothetical protein